MLERPARQPVAAGQVPEPRFRMFVAACAGREPVGAVGAEADRADGPLDGVGAADNLSGHRQEEAHGFVFAPGQEDPAVGTERDRKDRRRVPHRAAHGAAGRRFL